MRNIQNIFFGKSTQVLNSSKASSINPSLSSEEVTGVITCQYHAGDLGLVVQVPYVSAAVPAAHSGVAVGIKRPAVVGTVGVAIDKRTFRCENIAGPGVPRGQHTVKHINTV